MDIRSLIKIAGLMTFSLSSAVLSANSFADVNAETNSEDRFWIDRTHKNLSKINNFQVTTELTHSNVEQPIENLAPPIISELTFKNPDNFYQITTQPESLEGYEVSYSNNTITLHDNLSNTALQIKGLNPYKDKAAKTRVKGMYLYNKEHYDQTFTPSIHVDDRLSVGIDFKAKSKEFELKKIEGFSDYHYSVFMQASFIFKSGLIAQVKNTHIEFNKESLILPTIDLARLKSNKNNKIISWDFSKKSLSKKQIEQQISKDISWPEDAKNTWDFSDYQYFQQGDKKRAAAYYHSDEFFLITTTQVSSAETSKYVKEAVVGIPLVIDGVSVVLNQLPAFSSLVFNHNGIDYTLLSNIHPESMFSMVKAITIAK